jgi:hypothetical protein
MIQRLVTAEIKNGNLFANNFAKCDAIDEVKVQNTTGVAIQAKINDGAYKDIAADGSFTFLCTNEPDCITILKPGKKAETKVVCEFGKLPAMSTWGLIALVTLILGSGIYYVARRRRVAA